MELQRLEFWTQILVCGLGCSGYLSGFYPGSGGQEDALVTQMCQSPLCMCILGIKPRASGTNESHPYPLDTRYSFSLQIQLDFRLHIDLSMECQYLNLSK